MQKYIIVSTIILTLASMVEFPMQNDPELIFYTSNSESELAPTAFENLLGIQIQKIRKEKGFTIEELADMLGTPAPSIELIENGQLNPSDTFVSEFQYLLGCRLYLGT